MESIVYDCPRCGFYGMSIAMSAILTPSCLQCRNRNIVVLFREGTNVISPPIALATIGQQTRPMVSVPTFLRTFSTVYDTIDQAIAESMMTLQPSNKDALPEFVTMDCVALVKPPDPSVHDFTCTICMDDEKTYELLATLDCGHVFHNACIERWLRCESIACPICRKDVI